MELNSFASAAKNPQTSAELIKAIQAAVKKELLTRFPDVSVLVLAGQLSTDQLQPVGQKVRIMLEMQITTRTKKEETPTE